MHLKMTLVPQLLQLPLVGITKNTDPGQGLLIGPFSMAQHQQQTYPLHQAISHILLTQTQRQLATPLPPPGKILPFPD
jgi:hypothetical protein